jgi:hypothetical protein
MLIVVCNAFFFSIVVSLKMFVQYFILCDCIVALIFR